MIFHPIARDNNMNVVRYYLCLCILMNHFNVLTGCDLPMLPRIFGGVGSFFAISGFLMFPSFEKHPQLRGYFDRRARRILPPYVFIVLLAALSLWSVSYLGVGDYFRSGQLYKYLIANLSFMNFIEPTLPGVFADNPLTAVNGSLWTMKGEVICYFCVPAVYLLIRRYPQRASGILLSLMAVCLVSYVLLSEWLPYSSHPGMINVLAKQMRVFTFFYIGALINLNLDFIRRRKWWVLGFAVTLVALADLDSTLYLVLRPFSDSLLVIWFSIMGSWGRFASRYNSLSYDIYLFHYPIIQVLIATGVVAALGGWLSLLLTIVLSVALASFSWLCIGRPILRGAKKSTPKYSESAP